MSNNTRPLENIYLRDLEAEDVLGTLTLFSNHILTAGTCHRVQ